MCMLQIGLQSQRMAGALEQLASRSWPRAIGESLQQELDVAGVLQPFEKPLLAGLAQELIGIMTVVLDDGVGVAFRQRADLQDPYLAI